VRIAASKKQTTPGVWLGPNVHILGSASQLFCRIAVRALADHDRWRGPTM
jgi:hypothetical protein